MLELCLLLQEADVGRLFCPTASWTEGPDCFQNSSFLLPKISPPSQTHHNLHVECTWWEWGAGRMMTSIKKEISYGALHPLEIKQNTCWGCPEDVLELLWDGYRAYSMVTMLWQRLKMFSHFYPIWIKKPSTNSNYS